MEIFTTNPGLFNVAQNIFLFLDRETLLNCRLVSQSWKTILDNPSFWMKKSCGLTKKLEKSWKKLFGLFLNDDIFLEKRAALCLNKMLSHKESHFQSPLQIASEFGDLTLVNFIIENLEFLNQEEENYFQILPAITAAASNGHNEIVKVLINITSKPNEPNSGSKRTPLHFAAYNGHTEVVRTLINHIGDPFPYDKDGLTPMHYASRKGFKEIVKLLADEIENWDNNPNCPGIGEELRGWTPMHEAAAHGHIEVVKLLSQYTINPNPSDNDGLRPSEIACFKGHHDIVNFLLN